MEKLKLSELFPETISDLEDLYRKHEPRKGDSWRTCSIGYLYRKLLNEWDKFVESADKDTVVASSQRSLDDLQDAILVGLMLAARIRLLGGIREKLSSA